MSMFGSIGNTLAIFFRGKRDRVTKKPVGQAPLTYKAEKKHFRWSFRWSESTFHTSFRRKNKVEHRARRAMARLNPIRGV